LIEHWVKAKTVNPALTIHKVQTFVGETSASPIDGRSELILATSDVVWWKKWKKPAKFKISDKVLEETTLIVEDSKFP